MTSSQILGAMIISLDSAPPGRRPGEGYRGKPTPRPRGALTLALSQAERASSSRSGDPAADVLGELLHDAVGLLAHHRLAELAQLAEHVGVGVDNQLGLARRALDQGHNDVGLDGAAGTPVGPLGRHGRPPVLAVALDDAHLAFEAQRDRPDPQLHGPLIVVGIDLAHVLDARDALADRLDVHQRVPELLATGRDDRLVLKVHLALRESCRGGFQTRPAPRAGLKPVPTPSTRSYPATSP